MTTTTTLPLAPGHWTLDTSHSTVGFAIRHLGVSKVRGHFRRFEVDVVVGETLETSSVVATIHVDSIDTGNTDRDAHVLQPDILDVSRRPTLVFRSTRVELDRIEGDLTIGEVTQPVVLDVEFGGLAEFPVDGSTHAGFEATTEIRRKDFGIEVFGLGDVVKVELDLQLVAP
jgi:polyisoprenoid-binding protein YceI